MSWRQRLAELVAAGGLAAAGCTSEPGSPVPCGNVDPDPCICNRMPASTPQCVAEAHCQEMGWTWEFPDYGQPGPGGLLGSCVNPHPDARLPAPGPQDGLEPSD